MPVAGNCQYGPVIIIHVITLKKLIKVTTETILPEGHESFIFTPYIVLTNHIDAEK